MYFHVLKPFDRVIIECVSKMNMRNSHGMEPDNSILSQFNSISEDKGTLHYIYFFSLHLYNNTRIQKG